MYLLPLLHSHIASLSFPEIFFPVVKFLVSFFSLASLLVSLFCSVSLSFLVLPCFSFTFLTEDGQYLKSQGGATSRSVPHPRPSIQQPSSHPHHARLLIPPLTLHLAPSQSIQDLLLSSPDPDSLNDFAVVTLAPSLALTPSMCRDDFLTRQHYFRSFATTRVKMNPSVPIMDLSSLRAQERLAFFAEMAMTRQ